MGLFKGIRDVRRMSDHHGGMPSIRGAFKDLGALADDRGEHEVLRDGVPARAVAKGFAEPVPGDRFAMHILLTVHPPGGAPYDVDYVFPTTRMKAALTVGMEVPVKIHPDDPQRMVIAISAAGAFRTDDGGETWRPANRGLKSEGIPDPDAEVGHCVHNMAMHPSRPGVLFMQKHWDVMRSDDAGASWREVSGNLPSDFGFPIAVHAHEPETIYVVPITSDAEHFPPEGKLRVYRSRTGGNEWEALTDGLPQRDCYVNVLRDAMAVDQLDSCGVYVGTTGGQVYASADAGDTWAPIVRDLPAVLSVEVQTLP